MNTYTLFSKSSIKLRWIVVLFFVVLLDASGRYPIRNKESVLFLVYASEFSVSSAEDLEDAVKQSVSGDTILIASPSMKLKNAVVIDRSINLVGAPTSISCSAHSGSALKIHTMGVNVTLVAFERCHHSAVRISITEDKQSKIQTSSEAAEKSRTGPSTGTTESSTKQILESIRLYNVEFRNNTARSRFSKGSALSIVGCSLNRCKHVHVVLDECVFEFNAASIGGGIYAEAANVTITNSRFFRNSADLHGGAVHVRGHLSTLIVSDTTLEANRVVRIGRQMETVLRDGRPIEPSRYFRFPFPGSRGGAVDVRNVPRVSLSRVSFINNRAPAGGALAVELQWTISDARTEIEDCRFERNAAGQGGGPSTSDADLGGSMYLVSAAANAMCRINRCTFKASTAQHGGAVHFVGLLSMKSRIEDTLFEGNTAVGFGGAMVVRNTPIDLKACVVRDNEAKVGGGTFVTNNGMLKGIGLAGLPPDTRIGKAVDFRRNRATDGAGLACIACGDIVLQDVRFLENAATLQGGGVYVFDTSGSIVGTQCLFRGNRATEGGGVAVEAAENVGWTSAAKSLTTKFLKNSASSGSAIAYVGNRLKLNRLILSNVEVEGNNGLSTGRRSDGTVQLLLDGMPSSADGEILFDDVLMHSNEATFAGPK